MVNHKKRKFNKQQIDVKEKQPLVDKTDAVDSVEKTVTDSKSIDTVEVVLNDDDDFDASQTEFLTNAEAASIRKEYKNVRAFRMLNDQFIVYRVITRADQNLISNLSFEQQAYFDSIKDPDERLEALEDLRNDNILRYFVLFPRQERIEYCKENFGGFTETVVREILISSGYKQNTVSNPL